MKKIAAGIQGELGAFSQQAAFKLLGEDISVRTFERFEEVFRALAAGKIDAAVIPIENTLHGSVYENYDHLMQFNPPIAAETSIRIVHNLIAIPGVKFANLRQVYSHPVALNQCLDFFRDNPRIERVPFYDTAGSVKMIAERGLRDAGAIASSVAADIYGAKILRRSIEDDRQNFTRFFLLTRKRNLAGTPKQDTQWKTSVVFSTSNTPGTLFRALSVFALRDISLTKIESRPLRGKPWEYLFYVDCLGSGEDERVKKAISHLQEIADVRVLGSYPRSV